MSKEKRLNQPLQNALANQNLFDIKKYLEAGADILDDIILAMRIKNSEIITILVPYISESYKEKQTKNKINSERYQEYISRLLTLEYSIEEANKIILQKKYCSAIDDLLHQSHSKLIALGYQHKDIVRIASCGASFQNSIKSLLNSLEIIESGFSHEEVIKIVARDGGSNNLLALVQHEKPLRAMGFSRKDLIKVVAHTGGSNNLQALINYVGHSNQENTEISTLLTAEIRDALVKIVAHHGGCNNLLAFIQHEKPLYAFGFTREELIKVVAQDGGSKNLVALFENEFTIDRLGLSNDKRIYLLLQRKAGYQRLKIFLYYYLFFYHCNAVKALLAVCSISNYLSLEKLNTILALKALFYYLNEANLEGYNSSRFPDELSLLNKILEIANVKLKSDIRLIKLQGNNYRLTLQTSHSIILKQIEKKLIQYSFSQSMQLQELLNIRNAVCYRLLQNPEGNKEVYWLDVRPWKQVFPAQNLQITLAKLLKKGVKDGDILLEGNEFSSPTLSILHIGEHTLSVPVSVIEAIVNDYPNLHRYQLILSNYAPTDSETKLGFLYLYKTEKTLECVVKDGKKLDNLVINTSSLTLNQNDEIIKAFALTDSKIQLHQSTLNTLSRIILDTAKNYYFFYDDSNNIIEFIDHMDDFLSSREDKLITITKLNKSFSPANVIQSSLKTSFSEIITQVNDNNANQPNKMQYLSMPVIEVSPIRAVLPSKYSKLTSDTLGGVKKNLVAEVAENEFIESDNNSLYEPKGTLASLSEASKRKKLKKNKITQHRSQKISGINTLFKKGIYLGGGTYNRAYRFDSIVQKTRKNTAFEMDGAVRAVRVFNEINKALNLEPERAQVINENTWELPFIDGDAPSIENLSKTILEIYRTTERVVIDGYCKDNILKEQQSGKLYCIDPGLAVRRHSTISNDYWYKPNDTVRINREVHYKHMVALIAEYKVSKKPEKSLPIFCIFAIDFYDRNLLEKYGKTHDFLHEAFLTLGISVYFSILLKLKLNADACMKVLRQEIKIDLENLKKTYAENEIEETKTILKPLFFFPKYKTNELQSGLTTFKPKRQKVNDEIISQAVFRAKISQ